MKDIRGSFIWDPIKELVNLSKHGIDFTTAAMAFKDPGRKIFVDSRHSEKEPRFFCVGKAGEDIITVRFTYRAKAVRIIGAGYWRQGKKVYEKENRLH